MRFCRGVFETRGSSPTRRSGPTNESTGVLIRIPSKKPVPGPPLATKTRCIWIAVDIRKRLDRSVLSHFHTEHEAPRVFGRPLLHLSNEGARQAALAELRLNPNRVRTARGVEDDLKAFVSVLWVCLSNRVVNVVLDRTIAIEEPPDNIPEEI